MVVLGLVMLALSCTVGNKTQAGTIGGTARVAYFEGSVRIDGKDASLDMRVPDRVEIITGKDSVVEIVFADKNVFRVGPESAASIDFSKAAAEIDLKKGSIGAVLKKLKRLVGTDSFIIKTATAQAGVRGTALCVWSDGVAGYICCCNGTVRTIDANGLHEETLVSEHHTARLFKPAGADISVEAAGLLWHTDADVESLAARIGEAIDWSKLP